MFELPFVPHARGVVNSLAFQEFADAHLKDEFKEIHPICFWAHDHGLVHANKPVRTLEDMKGLKLRFPTRLCGEALRSMGVNAIGMPIPQVPESLAQRVIDGTVLPWEVVPSIKVQELVKNHTEIPGSPTLYVATFVLAMNKPKYEGLPADLKAILDKNSGAAAAIVAGRAWDDQAIVVSEMVKARGNTMIVLTDEEAARWRKATEPVIENWLKTTKERGLDGGKLLDSARAAIEEIRERSLSAPQDILAEVVAAAGARDRRRGARRAPARARRRLRTRRHRPPRHDERSPALDRRRSASTAISSSCRWGSRSPSSPSCRSARRIAATSWSTPSRPGFRQGPQAALDALWDLVYAAFAAFLAWRLAIGAAEAYSSRTTSMVLELPIDYAIAACAAIAAFLAVVAVLTAARRWRSAR